ncbi:MAG TPA: flagellar basal body M-ring protein FliF, partial [Aquabacterium sp.]|nr:flagellar basal body M-ring protein FliF [Aquabacterium sp.]
MEVTIPQPQALAPAPDGVLQVATPGFAQRVMALPAQRKFMLGGGVAVLLALMVAMVMWSQQADYKILFANLSDKDGGAILAQLQQ